MRPPLPWALALLLAAPLTQAAESNSTGTKTSKTTRSSSEDSDEGDSNKSGSFFGRLFNKGQDAPAPSGKKAPSVVTATGKQESKNEGKAETKTDLKPDAKTDSKTDLKADPKGKKPAAKVPVSIPEAPKTEDERFILARKAASEDPKVLELRNKADAAIKDSEATRLTRSYFRAMYGKMRTLEPSLKERIDLTEAAALRMLPDAAQ